MMEFNINEYVAVRLTDEGRAEHKRQHDELNAQFTKKLDYRPPKEDEEGWSKWQAWVLINTFGHMVDMGSMPPFETTIRVGV